MEGDSLYGAFVRQARLTPRAIAVADARRELTYAQLERLASGIAAELPDNPSFVGVVMDHGAEQVAAILAVLKSGAAYVPAEPSFPVERIQFMLTEADVDAVITQRAHDGLFRAARRVFVEAGRAIPDALPDEKPGTTRIAGPGDLAYVLYTSGTTGTPKGVCVENRNVTSYIDSFQQEFDLKAGDVMLQQSACSFDIFVEEMFGALLNGATLAIPPESAMRTPETMARFIEQAGVTVVDGFPYLIADLNGLAEPPRNVRLYISGGDVLRASYCDRLVERALVYNTYGPSETTCCATYFRVNGAEPLADGTYPVGRAIAHAHVEVLDGELRPVPEGETGEIFISGGGVSRGYLGERPEQANFVQRDGQRLYRSGDLGYLLPTGDIAFLRRKDSQVMIDGRRVECSEVENVLSADEAVERAVVRARCDERGLSYMTAYVVPAGSEPVLSELRARLARKLAGFMIPEFFVVLPEIPLNASGKPDDAALPVVLKA